MENILLKFTRLFILFARNSYGCLNSPYTTYRKLASKNTHISQTIYIWVLVFVYFAFVSLVRVGIRNPFLLTIKFNSLVVASLFGFLLLILLFLLLGKLFGGVGDLRSLYILWAYSLWPTIIWFLLTSLLYIILPPPRTFSLLGKIFSVFFMLFSICLFFWKLILYYLTFRFGLKLDLVKIGIISLILTPIICLYSVFMYNIGVFRIPFI